MLQKITLAFLGLATMPVAFAGTMGMVCVPGKVIVPCHESQWSFAADALYVDTVNSAKAYATLTPGAIAPLNNPWDWGVHLAGSYQYNTGNDIALSWLHATAMDSQFGLTGPFVIPTLAQPVVLPFSLTNQNSIDKVDAVLGQEVQLSPRNTLRFYAGAQYAGIQQNIIHYYAPGGYSDKVNYKGAGPVVGLDYSYEVLPQLSIIANSATSFLYGPTLMNSGYVISSVNFATQYEKRNTVVPGFEAKLGVSYAYTMAQGVVNVRAGYQVVDYLNAFQTADATSITTSNYALYGPYFGLKYIANA